MPSKRNKRRKFGKKTDEWKPRNPVPEGTRNSTNKQGERIEHWKDIVKENKLFETYYKEQQIVDAAEWDEFMTYLKKDLPSTFRITGTKSHAKNLVHYLESNFAPKTPEEENNCPRFISPIRWYPDDLAWESKLSKREIRKSPHQEKFHAFLINEQDCGGISRQEAVSMIPPLLLDVQSHHKVLDMCAAPGSKTAQIIETMHDTAGNGLPDGLVIANDSDSKRCYMLVHQSKRLQTPCCMITNHDASLYPCIRVHDPATDMVKQMFFDRILCDVPCSGDGTMRKNPLVWRKWNPHQGISLHRLQMRILTRGLEVLAVGGRLVYSTCSMNPLENEAVVGTLLQQSKGAIRLLDMSTELPGLKRRPGITTWKVQKQDGTEIKTFEDVDVGPEKGFKTTMFPPSPEVLKDINLERCMRVYPHDQDTGAFFIAVIEKTDKLPWQSAKIFDPIPAFKYLPWEDVPDKKKPICLRSYNQPKDTEMTKEENINENNTSSADVETNQQKETSNEGTAAIELSEASASGFQKQDNPLANESKEPPKKRSRTTFKEEPFVFINDEDLQLKRIIDDYEFSSSFPSNQLLIRSLDGTKRNIYFVSKCVRDVLYCNKEKLKVINTGVKVITRYGNSTAKLYDCEFRLAQEGLDVMQRFLGNKRCIDVLRFDVELLLKETEPFMSTLSESTQKALDNCPSGSLVFKYSFQSSTSIDGELSDLWLCGHKGKSSVRAMTAKCDRLHFMHILGIDYDASLYSKAKSTKTETTETSVESVVTSTTSNDDNDSTPKLGLSETVTEEKQSDDVNDDDCSTAKPKVEETAISNLE